MLEKQKEIQSDKIAVREGIFKKGRMQWWHGPTRRA